MARIVVSEGRFVGSQTSVDSPQGQLCRRQCRGDLVFSMVLEAENKLIKKLLIFHNVLEIFVLSG